MNHWNHICWIDVVIEMITDWISKIVSQFVKLNCVKIRFEYKFILIIMETW